MSAFADMDHDRGGRWQREGDHRGPWSSDHRDERGPWDHRDEGRIDLKVEENVQRYFERFQTLDLLIDSYTRNQLLGKKVKSVRISMASESGRDAAGLLINGRQIEASKFASRDLQDYIFTMDPWSNDVGRGLRTLELQMQGRFYVDKVVFELAEDDSAPVPFPMPSQSEVIRQQINQTFEGEGGLNLFRQFPLFEHLGQTVRRVIITAMSQRYSGTAMLLKNTENFGQAQAVGSQPTRLIFEMGGERIGDDLQSLRLQFNGQITVLDITVELDQNEQSWPGRQPMPMPIPTPAPRPPMPGGGGRPGGDIIRPR